MHWLLNYEALYDMKKEKLRYMELEIQSLTFNISLIMRGYGARKKQKEIEWKGWDLNYDAYSPSLVSFRQVVMV